MSPDTFLNLYQLSYMGTFPRTPRQGFIRAISLPEQHIDLALAGLLVAAEEYPQLDVLSYMGRIAILAERVRKKLRRYHTVYDALHATSEVMFDAEGFRGNRRNYYDPRNSFLSDVLDRRIGIPISLSIIYAEIARRAGYRLHGVGLPGHFLLRTGKRATQIFIDPFDRGGLLTRNECVQLVRGGDVANVDPSHYLRPLGNRAILRRMLTNLKRIYLRNNDFARALPAAERIQLIKPKAWQNLGDLARIQFELGDFVAATQSLALYLERAPRGEDLSAAKAVLENLQGRSAEPDGSGE